MHITNCSERQQGEPDVEVQEGQSVTGFIDARRQNDGVWEAWVWFSYDDESGWRSTRKDWLPMKGLTVLSVDDVPVAESGPPASVDTSPPS